MWVGLYIFLFIGSCASGINSNRHNILMLFIMRMNQKWPKPTPGHLSQRSETHVRTETCTPMFTAALFVTVKNSPGVLQQVNV